jgi:hypothetical protein
MKFTARFWTGPGTVSEVANKLMSFVTCYAGTEYVYVWCSKEYLEKALEQAGYKCFQNGIQTSW